MIGDDQWQPESFGGQRFAHTGDATVDRDDQLRAFLSEHLEGFAIETITLLETIGHVPCRRGTNGFETTDENSSGAHAVGVVVAVNDDLFTGSRCGQNLIGGQSNARQPFWIAQIGEFAGKKRPHADGVCQAANRQQTGNDRRHTGRAFDCRDQGLVVWLEMPAFGHRISSLQEAGTEYTGLPACGSLRVPSPPVAACRSMALRVASRCIRCPTRYSDALQP